LGRPTATGCATPPAPQARAEICLFFDQRVIIKGLPALDGGIIRAAARPIGE
jgi:hypothetical protein